MASVGSVLTPPAWTFSEVGTIDVDVQTGEILAKTPYSGTSPSVPTNLSQTKVFEGTTFELFVI